VYVVKKLHLVTVGVFVLDTASKFNALHYVETVVREDCTNCQFVCGDSRKVLSDLSQTISSCNVINCTVLYLQLPAET